MVSVVPGYYHDIHDPLLQITRWFEPVVDYERPPCSRDGVMDDCTSALRLNIERRENIQQKEATVKAVSFPRAGVYGAN